MECLTYCLSPLLAMEYIDANQSVRIAIYQVESVCVQTIHQYVHRYVFIKCLTCSWSISLGITCSMDVQQQAYLRDGFGSVAHAKALLNLKRQHKVISYPVHYVMVNVRSAEAESLWGFNVWPLYRSASMYKVWSGWSSIRSRILDVSEMRNTFYCSTKESLYLFALQKETQSEM